MLVPSSLYHSHLHLRFAQPFSLLLLIWIHCNPLSRVLIIHLTAIKNEQKDEKNYAKELGVRRHCSKEKGKLR